MGRRKSVQSSTSSLERPLECCVHGEPCGILSEDESKESPSEQSNESTKYDSVDESLRLVSAPLTPTRKNHYENLPPLQKLVNGSSCSSSAASASSELQNSDDEIGGIPKREIAALYKQYYLGVQSSDQAEKLLNDVSQFRLYHRIRRSFDIDSMRTSLRLYIVYLTSKGEYRHFPIVERPGASPDAHPYLSVIYGDPRAALFGNVAALLRHYTTYALFNEDSSIEIFRDVRQMK